MLLTEKKCSTQRWIHGPRKARDRWKYWTFSQLVHLETSFGAESQKLLILSMSATHRKFREEVTETELETEAPNIFYKTNVASFFIIKYIFISAK